MVTDMSTCDVNLIQNALGIQQTGPRTVIVPADPITWQSGKSYEYLTLVTSTDFGQAYISKKDVPAGTPLTNADYWIPAASYNAQLAAIQNDLTNVNSDVSALQTGQGQLENELSKQGTNIANEQTYAVYLGNSWTYGTGSSNGSNGLFARTKSLFTGASEFIVSGGAIAPFTLHNESFSTKLDQAIASPNVDNDKVTHVICMCTIGEANSYSSDPDNYFTSTYNALNTMRAKAQDSFPRLQHLIVVNSEARRDSVIENGGGISGNLTTLVQTLQIDQMLVALCRLTGWEYRGWIGSYVLMASSCFDDDNIHPNDTGYNILGPKARQALEGFCPSLPITFRGFIPKSVITFSSGTYGSQAFPCTLKDGTWYSSSPLSYVSASAAVNQNDTIDVYLPFIPGKYNAFNPPTVDQYATISIVNHVNGKELTLLPNGTTEFVDNGLVKVTTVAKNAASANDLVGTGTEIIINDIPVYSYSLYSGIPTPF